MASDLLTEAGARAGRPVLSEQPGSGVSGFEIMRPYTETAKALGGLGNAIEEATTPLAAAAGANAVTKDADGNISIRSRLEFTNGDRAYNAAARQAGLAAAKDDINRNMTDLRAQFDGDPAGFDAASKAYVQTITKKSDPLIRPFVTMEAQQQATMNRDGLVSSKHDVDLQRADNTLQTRAKFIAEQMDSLAFSGGTGTPEFQRLRTEYDDINSQRAANPKLALSPEMKAVEDERLDSKLRATSIVGQARRDFEKDGDYGRVLKIAETALNDTSIKLPESEKLQLLGRIDAHLKGANAVRTEEANAAVNRGQALRARYDTGNNPADDEVDAEVSNLKKYRRWEDAYKLEQSREFAKAAPALRYGTPTQAVGALDAMTKRGAAATASAGAGGGYFDKVIGKESGGDPSARNKDSTATGGGQFLKSTWDGLRARYPDLGLTPDGRTDPAQTAKALRVFTAENANTLGRSGIETTEKNLYMAHFLGAGGAVSLIKSMQSNPGQSAAALLPDAAASNRTVFYKPDGSARSVAEVYNLQTSRFAGTPADLGGGNVDAGAGFAANAASKEAIAKAQSIVNARLGDVWKNVEAAYKGGYKPMDSELQALSLFHSRSNDEALKKTINDELVKQEAKEKVAATDNATAGVTLSALQEAARTGQANPLQRDLIEQVRKQNEAAETTLKNEPTTYGVVKPDTGVQVPPPMDLSDPRAVDAAIQKRAATLAVVKQMEPTAADQPLSGADRKAFASWFPGAKSEDVASALGSMASRFTPEQLRAVFSDGDMKIGLAGMTRTGDPVKMTAAFAVLDKLQKGDPSGFKVTFGTDMLQALDEWQGKLRYMTPQQIADDRKRADDPAFKQAQERLGAKADDLSKHYEPKDIAQGLSGWLGRRSVIGAFSRPGMPIAEGEQNAVAPEAMAEEWRNLFRRYYVAFGDEGQARDKATERIGEVWGPSSLSGGRLMMHPPEKVYPPINGGHEYLQKELTGIIVSEAARAGIQLSPSGGVQAFQPELRPDQQSALQQSQAQHALISDRQTEADIAAKKPASYRIVIQDARGQWHAMADSAGKPMRFYSDVAKAQKDADEAMMAARQNVVPPPVNMKELGRQNAPVR